MNVGRAYHSPDQIKYTSRKTRVSSDVVIKWSFISHYNTPFGVSFYGRMIRQPDIMVKPHLGARKVNQHMKVAGQTINHPLSHQMEGILLSPE